MVSNEASREPSLVMSVSAATFRSSIALLISAHRARYCSRRSAASFAQLFRSLLFQSCA